MFRSHKDSSEYVPLATHQDGDSSDDVNVKDADASIPAKTSTIPSPVLFISIVVAILSAVNLALIPRTMSSYRLSESQLAKLPYPDLHLGFHRIDKLLHDVLPRPYIHSWPDKITRVSQVLQDAVYGSGVQVYINVQDSTIMKFPIPEGSEAQACAIAWQGPVETSIRKQDLTTKGDISEIEVWSVIAPSTTDTSTTRLDDLDFDSLSWRNRPVRGELLGTLNLQQGLLNATTVEFGCPTESKNLVVEFRCVRVDCHVSFAQIKSLNPKMGFELVRKTP